MQCLKKLSGINVYHIYLYNKILICSVCSEVSTTVGGYPATGPRVVHPQLFLPLPRSSSPLYKVAVGTPTHLLPSVSKTSSMST